MDIVRLASMLDDLDKELDDLSIDLFADEEEKKYKEEQKRKIQNELLFYNEFEQLYENSKEYELDTTLLYPFKHIINEQGEKVFQRKSKEEYKDDVKSYLRELQEAYEDGKIDRKTFVTMRKDAVNLGEKQIERIQEEEKEQEDEVDLEQDYRTIVEQIESTKRSFILNQIGEESYGALSYKYKNMQEVERKELLYKTHTGLCNEMGISFDMEFTKYDIKDEESVTRDGYCIKTKDINNVPFPLDTIILEQTYKLYIGQVLKNIQYTDKQKEDLTKMLYQSLSQHKNLILDKIKKRELTPYGC